MDLTQTLIASAEYIGTVAFAVSGALLAIQKKLDIFGVVFLAAVTALGGGIFRDLLLGNLPPNAFRDYSYLTVAVVTALVTFLAVWLFRKHFREWVMALEKINNVFDAIGLAAFSIVGAQVAIGMGMGENLFLCVFLGMTTGIGGGIFRDVLIREVPAVFRKHIYGMASIVGCLVYLVLLRVGAEETFAVLTGSGVIVLIRMLATIFRWNLPRIKLEKTEE